MTLSSSRQYRADIDGLRGIAVLVVVLFHAFPSMIPGGFIGVDIFFVISGYLISGIILRELQSEKFTFLHFYARRIRRIVPALAIVLAVTWIIGWFALLADDFKNLAEHISAGSAFLSNFLIVLQAGYFDVAAAHKPLLHLWSLGIEEQFYLSWPVLLVFWHRRKWNVSWLIWTILLGSFAFNLWQIRSSIEQAFYLLPSRYWELMIGCALAHHETGRFKSTAVGSEAKSIVAAALVIGGLLIIDGSWAYPGAWALFPTLAAVLFISAGPAAWINKRILALEPVVFVGRISYPLYLWHWMLLSIAGIIEEGPASLTIRSSIVAVSFVLAWLTWRIVELPLQTGSIGRLTSRDRQRVFVYAGAAVLAGLFCLGAETYKMNGFAARYPQFEALYKQAARHELGAHDCRDLYGLGTNQEVYCYRTESSPRVILWGDSHSDHLITGLARNAERPGVSLIQFGKGDCPALDGIERLVKGVPLGCLPLYKKLHELVGNEFKEARIVVLSSQIPINFKDPADDPRAKTWKFASIVGSDKNLSPRDVFKEALSRTIRFLEAHGKVVVLFIDIPELDLDPLSYLDTRPLRISKKTLRPCEVPMSDVVARQREYRKIIAELQVRHPSLKVFDPIPYLCDSDHCECFKNGELMYRDSNHLSIAGSIAIGIPLRDFLDRIQNESSGKMP